METIELQLRLEEAIVRTDHMEKRIGLGSRYAKDAIISNKMFPKGSLLASLKVPKVKKQPQESLGSCDQLESLQND